MLYLFKPFMLHVCYTCLHIKLFLDLYTTKPPTLIMRAFSKGVQNMCLVAKYFQFSQIISEKYAGLKKS